ncbi:MAG: hypothetical protein LC662_13165 [Rhodothermaceae bacterium]|nr:hypothetical protein [Rhodothermaceae bacterium]
MRLLLCYLILTGFFLLSVTNGSPEIPVPGSYAPPNGFYEVSQDGTVSASTINPAGKSATRRNNVNP